MTQLQETLVCPFQMEENPEYLLELSCNHFTSATQWREWKGKNIEGEVPLCPLCRESVTEVGHALPMRKINQFIGDIKDQCATLNELLQRNQDMANMVAYSSHGGRNSMRTRESNQDSFYYRWPNFENDHDICPTRTMTMEEIIDRKLDPFPLRRSETPCLQEDLFSTISVDDLDAWPDEKFTPSTLPTPIDDDNNYNYYNFERVMNHEKVWQEDEESTTREMRENRTPTLGHVRNSLPIIPSDLPNTRPRRRNSGDTIMPIPETPSPPPPPPPPPRVMTQPALTLYPIRQVDGYSLPRKELPPPMRVYGRYIQVLEKF